MKKLTNLEKFKQLPVKQQWALLIALGILDEELKTIEQTDTFTDYGAF